MDVEGAADRLERDLIGDVIRATFRDRGVGVGLLAAIVITIGSWLTVFGLTWIPGTFTGVALGVTDTGEHVSAGPRLAASLFSPWLIAQHVRAPQLDGFVRSVSLPGAGVLLVFIILVGIGVRRATGTVRSRAVALLVAGVTSATALAIASAFISYRIGDTSTGQTFTVTHAASSLFWIPLLWVVGGGLFSFGVVAGLHAPLRVALRRGGALVGLVAVIAAVAFPIVVVTWKPINQTGKVYWSYDLAEGFWHWGSGVAGVVTPLAFGADAHLAMGPSSFSPFVATAAPPATSSGDDLRLPELAKYMSAHSSARLTGYAGTGGTAAHVVLLVGAALVLLLFALASARATHLLGAPRAVDGLRNGLLLGLAAFLFVLALKWITTAVITAHSSTARVAFRWGLDSGPLFQTGGELLALCGITGLIYAALRPSSYRYHPWRPRVTFAFRGGEQRAVQPESPTSAAPASSDSVGSRAPGPTAAYCVQCGRPAQAGDAFCSHCGAPVRTGGTRS